MESKPASMQRILDIFESIPNALESYSAPVGRDPEMQLHLLST